MCINVDPPKTNRFILVEARSYEDLEPDEKKTKLETVDESTSSFHEVCKSHVESNMNYFKNALDTLKEINKQGNGFLFCVCAL